MDGLPMQCAWCRRFYQLDAVLEPPPPALAPDASHGICLPCLAARFRLRARSLATAGDVLGAVRAERQRLLVGRALRHRRRAALADETSNLTLQARLLQERTRALLARSIAVLARRAGDGQT